MLVVKSLHLCLSLLYTEQCRSHRGITPFTPHTITAIILHKLTALSHVSLQRERWEFNEYRSLSIGLFVLLWLLCIYQSTRWILRSDTRLQNIKHQKSHKKQYDSASGDETDQFSWTNQATDLCCHFPVHLLEHLLYSKSGILIINQTNNCRIRKCTDNQTWAPINKEVSCYKLQIPDYHTYPNKIQNAGVRKCI